MKIESVVFALTLLVTPSCSKTESGEKETPNDEATATPKTLPAKTGPDCSKVVTYLTPIVKGLAEGVDEPTFAKNMTEKCETDWPGPLRTCALKASAPLDFVRCRNSTIEEVCKESFVRLQTLASNAGLNDPSLASKSAAYQLACQASDDTARKCLYEATTLDEFKSCKGGEHTATVVASEALNWEAPAIPGLTAWKIDEEESRMDGKRTVTAVRLATETIEGNYQRVRPRLVLRCEGKSFDIFFNVGQMIDSEGYRSYRTTRIKVDDEDAFKWKADESTDGTALFMRKPRKLAPKIAGKSKLLFEFSPFGKRPTNVSFDVDGFDAALARMSDCAQ